MNEEKLTTKKEWVSPEFIELDIKETAALSKNNPVTNENLATPSASLS